MFQSVAAYNLVSGNGLTYPEVHVNDFEKVIHQPLNRWPPGYSLLVAGIYALCGNLVVSTLLLDLFAIFGFLFFLLRLLKELEFPGYLVNLLILFNGFTIAIYISQPTDLHAVALLLANIYLAIRFFKRKTKPFRSGLLLGISAFLPCFLRYMYLPAALVPGLFLLIAGLSKKERSIIRAAGLSLLITFGLSVGMLIFNKFYAGAATYVMPMEKGFFPSHLLTFYPFIYGSFINIEFLFTQLSLRTRYDYTFWFTNLVYLNIITCGLGMLFSIFFIPRIKRFAALQTLTAYRLFVIISIAITVICVLLTGYLSIVNGRKITLKTTGIWTFIGDGRYFAFIMVTIPIITGYYLFTKTINNHIRLLRYLFVILVFFEITHTGYFLLRKFNYIEPLNNATLPLAVKNYLQSRIVSLKTAGLNVVVTGHRETIANWATLNGAKGLLDSDELVLSRKVPGSGTVLLLVVKQENIPFYQTYLSDSHSQADTLINGFHVFSNQPAKDARN